MSAPQQTRHEGRLSIAMATCNGARYLPEQLDSLLVQTRLPDEMIIMDDCSVDDSVELLQAFANRAPFAVTLSVNEHRLGPAANFARALQACQGDWIALCDQDDVWLPHRIEASLTRLTGLEAAHPGLPLLVHTRSRFFYDDGTTAVNPDRYPDGSVPAMQILLQRLLLQNTVTGCTTTINRRLRDMALPLPAEAIMHDWWLALTAAAYGELAYLPETCVHYRRHAGAVTRHGQAGGAGIGLRRHYHGLLSVMKTLRGRPSHQRELEQTRAFIEKSVTDSPRVRRLVDTLHTVRTGGFPAVWRYVHESGIEPGDRYARIRAALGLSRCLQGPDCPLSGLAGIDTRHESLPSGTDR